MPVIHNEKIDHRFRIKFLIPVITLSVVCCLIILVFSVLLINRVNNNNMYIIGELLVLLIVFAAFLIITKFFTNRLMNDVITAEETAHTKEMFLAQVSHEIRTPMNVILGISEIQLLNKNLSKDAEEGYKKIYESGSLLMSTINNILDFTKMNSGGLEIACANYNIPGLIKNTIKLIYPRYKKNSVSFQVNLDKNTPYELTGDEFRIQQILYNLLSNAFKFTDTGEVELSVRAEEGENDKTAVLVLVVRDTGQGMAENQVAGIFDEYMRFNLDVNRSIPGMGLGMSITKRLIDMMGAEIIIESSPGKGSVFTVRLSQIRRSPAVCGSGFQEFKFDKPSLRAGPRIKHKNTPAGKVLIVDDIISNLIIAKGLLSPYGLNIETVNSGFEAVDLIKSNNSYDIIFMDHMMPVMDGVKTAKILRDMGYTRPIVALTANAVIGQEEMFLSNGFDGFISKPIGSGELNNILIEFIGNIMPDNDDEETVDVPLSDALTAAAVLDIQNAVTIINRILPDINAGSLRQERSVLNLDLFITTVHGMKSALANIGENLLSDAALKLEKAGGNNEIDVILEKTPEFLLSLRSLNDKIKRTVTKNSGLVSPDDIVFLHSKLDEIKTACAKFIPGDAKKAIKELKQKTWPDAVNNTINDISLYLIRGEFSKAVSATDRIITSDLTLEMA